MIVDGGTNIGPWKRANVRQQIYRANLGDNFDTRQIYVNGVRAQRARGEMDPDGWILTPTGFLAPDTDVPLMKGGKHIELAGRAAWKEFRCPISDTNGRIVTMSQPCWKNAQIQPDASFSHVSWIENSCQFLKKSGQWCIEQHDHQIYYLPRVKDDIKSAVVTAGGVNTLVEFRGSLEAPVHNIILEDISFEYTGWTGPNTKEGYAPLQAGFFFTGDHSRYEDGHLERMPAAVSLIFARHITIRRDQFTHLGGAGISVRTGSAYDDIVGCIFSDASGSGALIGETTLAYREASATGPRNTVHDIGFFGNKITNMGAEYHDNVGIFAGYVERLAIVENEIWNLPYTGISVGWG